MCCFDDPHFQAPPPLQRPTFLHLVSVLMPSVFHFVFFNIFRPISRRFWWKFSSKHTYLANLFPKPYFLKKKICSAVVTLLLKTCVGHTHQKNKLSAPLSRERELERERSRWCAYISYTTQLPVLIRKTHNITAVKNKELLAIYIVKSPGVNLADCKVYKSQPSVSFNASLMVDAWPG